MRCFAHTLAAELAPRRIRVNALCPGPIDTATFDAASDEVRDALVAKIPFGRMGQTDGAAAAALFLASDKSRFITAAELCIDGGLAQV